MGQLGKDYGVGVEKWRKRFEIVFPGIHLKESKTWKNPKLYRKRQDKSEKKDEL